MTLEGKTLNPSYFFLLTFYFIFIEKAVFECLEDNEGEYEELEDDFIF